MTHDQFIYGMNAGFAEYTAKLSLESLQGKPISIHDQENERLACILMDVINDHNEFGGNLLEASDYEGASIRLNLILGTAYSYPFVS